MGSPSGCGLSIGSPRGTMVFERVFVRARIVDAMERSSRQARIRETFFIDFHLLSLFAFGILSYTVKVIFNLCNIVLCHLPILKREKP